MAHSWLYTVCMRASMGVVHINSTTTMQPHTLNCLHVHTLTDLFRCDVVLRPVCSASLLEILALCSLRVPALPLQLGVPKTFMKINMTQYRVKG